MIRAALILLLASSAFAQSDVRVMFTPEPLAVNLLGVKSIGIWDVQLVNYSAQPVTISVEMLLMAAPAIHRIDRKRAQQLIARANSQSWRSRLLRGFDYLSIPLVAIPGGGIITISKQGLAALALGTMLLHRVSDNLQAQQPDLSAYTDDLASEITLAPFGQHGFSMTATMFAGKIKGAATVGPVQIYLPAQKTAAAAVQPSRSEVAWINSNALLGIDGF